MKYAAIATWDESTNRFEDLVFGKISEASKAYAPTSEPDNMDIYLSEIYFGFNLFNDEHFYMRKFDKNSNENLWIVGNEDIFSNKDDARKKLLRDIFNRNTGSMR